MKRTLSTLAVAVAMAFSSTAASADVVKTSSHSYAAVPATANAVTTIDGYLFTAMPYYNGSPAVDSAVEVWWALEADPNYLSLPPIKSISADTTVSGTVPPPDDDEAARSSWG